MKENSKSPTLTTMLYSKLSLTRVVGTAIFFTIVTRRAPYSLDGEKKDVSLASSKSGDLHECLDIAISQICTSQQGFVNRSRCNRDPKRHFLGLTRRAAFNGNETNVRNLFADISALSIGSGPKTAGGLCDDVYRKKQTLCTDRPQLDLFDFTSWLKLFSHRQDGVSVIHAEHVLEHFHPMQAQQIAAASFLMLESGGVFRVAVPDGYKPSPSYQQYIRPGRTSSGGSTGGQKHMVSWTIDSLGPIFENVGFDVIPREYFDFKGEFHTSDAGYKDKRLGRIKRSFRGDKRNNVSATEVVNSSRIGVLEPDLRPGEPRYTSLWFDAVKPAKCRATMAGALL